MTSEEYVINFFSNSENESSGHQAFLEEFSKEFESKISCTNDYYGFQNAIFEMFMLFKAILIDKNRRKYTTKRLWKAFYAIYVVPARRKLYPEEQERIDKRRKTI